MAKKSKKGPPHSLRFDEDLEKAIKAEMRAYKRSFNEQIEHWTELGRMLETRMRPSREQMIENFVAELTTKPTKNQE